MRVSIYYLWLYKYETRKCIIIYSQKCQMLPIDSWNAFKHRKIHNDFNTDIWCISSFHYYGDLIPAFITLISLPVHVKTLKGRLQSSTKSITSLLAHYPGEGSAVRICRLQKFMSSASSGTTRSSRMSRFTRSRHLPLGLPLGRLPGISMSITCLRLLSCSLRCTCPNHLSLLSLALLFILPTPSSFLISSRFILSFTVTPLILLSILISVFSRIFSSFTPVVQHSAQYKMTGLTTVVYSLVFNFVGIFLSAITGPSSLHFCHPVFTLALTAVSDPPSFYLLSLAPVLSIFANQSSLLLLLLFLIHPLR